MCLDTWRHYTTCDCEIYAYIWKCKDGKLYGPCSPPRGRYVAVKDGAICRYHDYVRWHPSKRASPVPVPDPMDWDSDRPEHHEAVTLPVHARELNPSTSSISLGSDWDPDRPDIDRAAIGAALDATGRVATAEKRSLIGADWDPDDACSDGSVCEGCDGCLPSSVPLNRRTYAEGYNDDSWEDLYHPGYASGDEAKAKEKSVPAGTARRLVARRRRQREDRERTRVGRDRYDAWQRVVEQRRRARRARAEYLEAVEEDRRIAEELAIAERAIDVARRSVSVAETEVVDRTDASNQGAGNDDSDTIMVDGVE